MPEIVHFHRSNLLSGKVDVNVSQPILWCVIPPKTAYSIGRMDIWFSGVDTVGIDRMGWFEVAGYIVHDTHKLNQDLKASAWQIWDDYIPKIDPIGTDDDINNDEFFAGLEETTGTDSPGIDVGDNIEGSDQGLGAVQRDTLLSHPAVFHQVDYMGLGPQRVFHSQVPLGMLNGNGVPVTDTRQRYFHHIEFSLDMKKIRNFGCFLLGVSIPRFDSAETDSGNRYDPLGRNLSPWDTWEDMFMALENAPLELAKSYDLSDASFGSGPFEELMRWKRNYGVGDDTWENVALKYYIRGSDTLSYPARLWAKHI